MRWVEVKVEVRVKGLVVVVAAVVVEVVGAGRAGWVVDSPPGRAVVASAPVVGIGRRIRWASRVIRKSAPNAARR